MYDASCIANKQLLFDIATREMTHYCLTSKEKGITDNKFADAEVVVSLTTYSKRLYEVYLTIESIMQGTMKPNRIVLWLEDALKGHLLPLFLQKQMERGLEIKFCKDIRSYKKLIPSLKEYPNSVIITIDDDVIYNADVVEKLVNAYNADPNHVYANRVNEITFDHDGIPCNYNKWKCVTENYKSSNLHFFTGVGGVLYPPHCFNDDVFNEDAFMSLAQYGDDIWFYAMSLINGYNVVKVFTHNVAGNDFLVNESVQDISLFHINTEGRQLNDLQISAVFDKYDIYRFLKS